MKKDSKKIVFMILAVIGFITVLVGSYAFISVNLTGTKKQVITAGSLQLELEEKEGITLTNALPAYDEVGMLGEAYEFTLRNSSNFLMKYELELVDETKGEEVLAYEDLRYGLTKDGVTMFGSIAELENMIIDSGNIGAKTEINYQFRMWINHEVTDDTRLNGKSRTFKFNISAATSDDDIILAATLDGEALAEFPTREDNYGVESIKCTDDLSASFDPTTWSVTVDGITKSNTSCIVNFSSDITLEETDEAITMAKSELYAFYKGTFSGTATSDEVLSGKTVYINGVETTGTMPNNGAVSATVNAGESYTIPEGYHDGTGTVTGNSLESQTSATAVAADIASGKTAWVNGKKITGTRSAPVTSQTGTFTHSWVVNLGYSQEAGSGRILFPAGFESIPTVTITCNYADKVKSYNISNIQKTGFDYKIISTGGTGAGGAATTVTFTWTAKV